MICRCQEVIKTQLYFLYDMKKKYHFFFCQMDVRQFLQCPKSWLYILVSDKNHCMAQTLITAYRRIQKKKLNVDNQRNQTEYDN